MRHVGRLRRAMYYRKALDKLSNDYSLSKWEFIERQFIEQQLIEQQFIEQQFIEQQFIEQQFIEPKVYRNDLSDITVERQFYGMVTTL